MLDDSIGRLVQAVAQANQSTNTIFFFSAGVCMM
jgi:hypothetical protein